MGRIEGKKRSERKILSELMEAPQRGLRWKELLERTKISSRTLKKRLEDLENKGIVERRADADSREYPTPIYYVLRTMPSKRRRRLHTEKTLLSHSISQFQAAAENLSMNDSEFLITMARQISTSLLYAFLFSIRETSEPSLHEGLIDGFHRALALRLMRQSNQSIPSEEEWTRFESLLPRISLVQVANTLSVLRRVFPSEIKALEGVVTKTQIV